MAKYNKNVVGLFYFIVAVCAYGAFKSLWIFGLIFASAFVMLEYLIRLDSIAERLEKILDELKK